MAAMDSQLEQLKLSLESAVAAMSGEQLSWHPAGKWCAAEILEHLFLTYTGTIKGFEKLVMSAKPLATRPSMRQRLRTFVVTGLSYMPEGRKAPTPSQPKGLAREMVLREIGGKMAAMDAIITECEQRFGRRAPLLDHPILGPLSAAQWRKFHAVHGRHHLKQILRLQTNQKTEE